MTDNDALRIATESFKSELGSSDPLRVVQSRITTGDCVEISPQQYASLRAEVAQHFGLHPTTDIKVVGSAKLGFSIAPGKQYRPFGDRSDIDVAIISAPLFRQIWGEVSRFVHSGAGWDRRREFMKYQIHGWIRPDKLPSSEYLRLVDEWFEFFRQLTKSNAYGPYRIAAGLYFDIDFLEQYQARAVASCIPIQ